MKNRITKAQLMYAFYTVKHPADGFYEIRHRERGSLPLAILWVFAFGLSFSINRQYAGFVVNGNNPMSANSPLEILSVMFLFFLFCVGNWSVTCLMEGEGRFKDIVICVGYSMIPMVLVWVPATLLSHIVAQNEQAYYYVLITVSILYFVFMAIIGIMTVHGFTLKKTLLTLLLTFAAMFIILFLLLLVGSLIGQMISFIQSIYNEVMLRI